MKIIKFIIPVSFLLGGCGTDECNFVVDYNTCIVSKLAIAKSTVNEAINFAVDNGNVQIGDPAILEDQNIILVYITNSNDYRNTVDEKVDKENQKNVHEVLWSNDRSELYYNTVNAYSKIIDNWYCTSFNNTTFAFCKQ